MTELPEPFRTEHLDVGDGHALYLEQSGNPEGAPALFLHGGPGGGSAPRVRSFFDPAHYRIVLFDQRGAGQSTPNVGDDFDAAMHENNTPKLIADIERIREHLGVERWPLVLGGSWGSTLAIAYAEAYPERVDALVLRGIFTFERDEVDGLFRNGRVADHYPAEWERYCAFAKRHRPDESDLIRAYMSMLEDTALREEAAQEFVRFELSISKVHVDLDGMDARLEDPSAFMPFAACEIVYMIREGFLTSSLLAPENLAKLKGIHIRIVHGRSDHVCLPKAAWRFAKGLEAAGIAYDLKFIVGAGHSDSEPGIAAALREATDALRQR
ncbi:MAG: prolyl aminopeptidase [Myxococcota bacterium]